jgi:hypothetical protein
LGRFLLKSCSGLICISQRKAIIFKQWNEKFLSWNTVEILSIILIDAWGKVCDDRKKQKI